MRKRNWVLLIVAIVTIVAFILVINLSSKNKKLGFISDDSRQLQLVSEIYPSIIEDNIQEDNVTFTKDNSIYFNFITFKHYVLSHEASINKMLSEYAKDEDNAVKYVISNDFNLKKLTFNVKLQKEGADNYVIYTYRLGNSKDGKITYKLIKKHYLGQ